MKISFEYGSHIPMILKAAELTDGDILELGSGIFSTPLIHWIGKINGRNVLTIESDSEWLDFCMKPFSDHSFRYVDNFKKARNLIKKEWGMALVDHSPADRRKHEIRRLANLAKIIVVHDADQKHDHIYKYSEIYPLFKYKYIFKGSYPQTAVLSNFINLDEKFNDFHPSPKRFF